MKGLRNFSAVWNTNGCEYFMIFKHLALAKPHAPSSQVENLEQKVQLSELNL